MKTFTNLYPLSKTLRFELKPIGMTLDHIRKNGLLEADAHRAEEYEIVKKVIDDFHKLFIDRVLKKTHLDWKPLMVAVENYRKDKSAEKMKVLEGIQTEFRKQLSKGFSTAPDFDSLFKKELFTKLLPEHLKDQIAATDKQEAVETFAKFSTYFTGFHENRKNMYSDDKISTGVPFRLVHDNFPKFLANLEVYQALKTNCPDILRDAEKELSGVLDGLTLAEIFDIDFYNCVLTQKGITYYNLVVGGQSSEAGSTKLRGINEFSNLYRQQHPQLAQKAKAMKMTLLFKQILSDRETLSYIPEMFENDAQVQRGITTFLENEILAPEINGNKVNVLDEVIRLFASLGQDKSPSRVYIPQAALPTVSKKLLGEWNALNGCLFTYGESLFGSAESPANKKKVEKWLKLPEISLQELNKALETSGRPERILDFWRDVPEHVAQIKSLVHGAQTVLNKTYSYDLPLREQEEDIASIKALLDSLQDLLHLMKVLDVDKECDRDLNFYSDFDELLKQVQGIIPLYNKVRNYATQKLAETQKYKLNFENPTLANGWDLNKEDANSAVVLIKDGLYFLGIMNVKDKPKFALARPSSGGPCYRKMIYKLLPGPNKMLPKVFFSAKGIPTFNPPADILAGYNEGRHKKGPAFDKAFCHRLIDYFKGAISQHPDWSQFGFVYSDTKTYEDISGFYREVSEQGYKLTFTDIPEDQIQEWVDAGKLYLFQIYNKDFAKGSSGTPNLHTLYWKSLFAPENLQDVVMKLNGEAELFYRRNSITKITAHQVGEKLVNRRDVDKQPIPDDIYRELFLHFNNRLTEKLSDQAKTYLDKVVVKDVSHPIIKDRHYTEPKFLFHVPLTMNFKAAGGIGINEKVRDYIKSNPSVNIIGIDRGERNLLYITLIDQTGKLIKQKSFNLVGDFDYHAKLDQREHERDAARKSWSSVGKIKDLKEGYLSQVIHQITTLMVDNNAIIVLEDLNFGFKRGRFCVEKQVYQKFEKMLIDKLNYLVFKDAQVNEPGSVLHGYQLTAPFESFQKLGRQSGFLFYIPAAYTSKIDPTTGFVNLLDTKYENVKEAQDLFSKMDGIRYNPAAGYFEFAIDYDKFKTQQTDHVKRWTVCTYGEVRYAYSPATKTTDVVNVSQRIKDLFQEEGIAFDNGQDLKEAITTRSSAEFHRTLIWLLKITLQLRHSRAETGEDFILSPVKNKSGEFFKSSGDPAGSLPADADANGAYHIALKGLYWVNLLSLSEKPELKIEHKDWFKYIQTRNN